MTMISDLSDDLLEEILSRVPITCLGRVRSTRKGWRSLLKDQSFTKKHHAKAAKQFLVKRTWGCGLDNGTPTSFSLLNIKDLPSIKEIAKIISPVEEIDEVYQCDGLFLCVMTKKSSLVVWNPYMCQTRLIKTRKVLYGKCSYGIGYDNNNNHKVLRFLYLSNKFVKLEIYDLRYNSWRYLDIATNFCIYHKGVSLKGNTYFVETKGLTTDFVICFDYTTERFGARLSMPFNTNFNDDVVPSCVRGEQLALLHVQGVDSSELEIWITTTIEPDAMSWSKFFKVKPPNFLRKFQVRSFFIDNEKKAAVICGRHYRRRIKTYETYVVGECGNYEKTSLIGDVFSYVPSLVLIQQ